MIKRIGFVVLGQLSVDDIIPELTKKLSHRVQVLAHGALDGLTEEGIEALGSSADDYLLACKIEPGKEALIAYDKVLPRVQECINRLESEGAELITVLCGADWDKLKSSRLLINPGSILPQLVVRLSRGKKLGVVLPTILQVDRSEEKYRRMGASGAVGTYVRLYEDGKASEKVRGAADFLISENVDLVWMPCMAMNGELQYALQKQVKRPVILAQSMLFKVIDELIG